MTEQLPRVVIWLLTRRLAGEWREFVLGDLEEEFRARADGSVPAARLLTRPLLETP